MSYGDKIFGAVAYSISDEATYKNKSKGLNATHDIDVTIKKPGKYKFQWSYEIKNLDSDKEGGELQIELDGTQIVNSRRKDLKDWMVLSGFRMKTLIKDIYNIKIYLASTKNNKEVAIRNFELIIERI